ncbi:dihydrolipoyl dehydrogenase [Hoeflea prorocentri]|uniref:Dihydrolipoyl dehydrogenase n=1 Tax=Hoeflea prorocentri TaxID=1922333 RepID=A0A9X3UKC4_9HYPH|nr:dihydrolipoyl dehydrogenase [Hoeflea prorocentri]MCY6380734.1 dihydrolipoyl dehydrogenase [Hoeflea prorocentri]MDA5398534.1 dihydrolipoyl dehydrogenase [Hoeflea prorocentri]
MNYLSCEVLVIGGGPGGYVTAIRAGQLGLDTILVEKKELGGTCLNVGCIPSKAMIHVADEFEAAVKASQGKVPGISVKTPKLDLVQAIEWKDGIVKRLNGGVAGLLKKAGVTVINGQARMRDGKTCSVAGEKESSQIKAKFVVLAPGSEPVELEALPFGGHVISSTQALRLESLPRKLAVVGGGYIGLELGTAFAKMGSKVTVLEASDRLLPQYDKELSDVVAKQLKKLGIIVHLNARAGALEKDGKSLSATDGDGKPFSVEVDKVLVTVGRKPRLDGWGLRELQLTMDGGFIAIDSECRTSMTDVFAIGDVTGEPMLAHRAMAQGEVVAELIAGKPRAFEPAAIPAVCFTDPEIVSVGLSPDEARNAGYDVITGKFPLAANGRAMTLNAEAGFVRVVARKDNELVLGIQAVGTNISEFASGFSAALELGACLEDIASTIHAHPTQGEGIQEAAMVALGQGLHI